MEITLTELLDAREQRVLRQKTLQKEYNCPLICFTMNIAGPIKSSPMIKRAFDYGLDRIEKELCDYKILNRHIEYQKCGPVAFYSVDGSADKIKDVCVAIEESCRLGRLFDVDVLDASGAKLERSSERCCIVCHKKGRACAAGRLHSVEVLQKTTEDIIVSHFADMDAEYISTVAKTALIKEVLTTPKPGLVDVNNNGSHKDMNVESFIKSANALASYFKQCVKIGIQSSSSTPDSTFQLLRSAGIDAEKEMFQSTGGVNTHKGIIYSMGIICGALGRLWKTDSPIPKTNLILDECKNLVKLSAEADFTNITPSTAGARAYINGGVRGIRGEVADGFPSVQNIALPTYKNAISEGATVILKDSIKSAPLGCKADRFGKILSEKENDAGVLTLLHLISQIYDTSVYNRGGERGVLYAKKLASALLQDHPVSISAIESADSKFIEMNLSPGGAADLLAITYFLHDLEKSDLNAKNDKIQI